MIKFPTTIYEYTDGKLWREGVDESIARRILVGLHTLEDQEEVDLRKEYLAHFYYDKGEYNLALALAKKLLLENKFVEDNIILIKYICGKTKDAEEFGNLLRVIDTVYNGKFPQYLFEDFEDLDELIDPEFVFVKNTGKGKIKYLGDVIEYYRDNKLIFTVDDKNKEALFKNTVANHLLFDDQPEAALELLSTIKLDALKRETRIICHATFASAYCMLEDFDKAYDYSQLVMEAGLFVDDMADILYNLYKKESPNFSIMKEFFLGYKRFTPLQLCDVHSLSKEIDDEEFWEKVYANNPIDPNDASEETLMLKGMIAFNAQDFDDTERVFKQATSLYGRMGKSWQFRYYFDVFKAKSKKGAIPRNMPQKLYSVSVDDVNTFIDKKLFPKLKKCESLEDFVRNADEYLTEIDNMLLGVYVKPCDAAGVLNRLYKMNYVPIREVINKAIVDDGYASFFRTLSLANFMMFSGQKTFICGREVYDNPFVGKIKVRVGGKKEPYAYGMAILLACEIIFNDVSNNSFKKLSNYLKKIYVSAKSDYSEVSPLAVFAVTYAFFNKEKVRYVKGIVTKDQVKDFVSEMGHEFSLAREIDDYVFDFLVFADFEIK